MKFWCADSYFHTCWVNGGVSNQLTNLAISALNKLLIAMKGMLEEAVPYYEKALKNWKAVFGADSREVAIGLNNLAQLLQAQGKLDEAKPLIEEAISIGERALGRDHPDVATWLNKPRCVVAGAGQVGRDDAAPSKGSLYPQKGLGKSTSGFDGPKIGDHIPLKVSTKLEKVKRLKVEVPKPFQRQAL